MRPYIENSRACGKAARMSRMCASESAAAVLVTVRRALRSKVFSVLRFRIIENAVGTPGNTVTRSRAIASRMRIGKASERCSTTHAPTRVDMSTW